MLAGGDSSAATTSFRAWFASLDRDGDGFLTIAETSAFMRRSRLTDSVLRRVWEAVPHKGDRKGHVDARAFAELMYCIADQQCFGSSSNPFEASGVPDMHMDV
jgi:Ca2+-binding EF-hand superfamily protein